MKKIVFDLKDLIDAANSRIEITASKGDANAVAAQIFVIIGPSINQARLNRYPHYYISKTLGAEDATVYINLLNTMFTKLIEYKAQININKFDEESRAQNSQMQNRLTQLQEQGKVLKQELLTALNTGQGEDAIDQIITKISTLTADINLLEKAWDLDLWVEEKGIDEKLDELAQNPIVGKHYAEDGGEDDGMSVSDEYKSVLACSLFSILAVKGEWLGTKDPSVLHGILRKTGQLKQYDDNKIVAKVRYLAGMTPTIPTEKINLRDYIAEKKQKGEKDSFIVDVAGIAHTFAAVWKDGDYKKVDETGSNGNLGEYATNQVLAVWK